MIVKKKKVEQNQRFWSDYFTDALIVDLKFTMTLIIANNLEQFMFNQITIL